MRHGQSNTQLCLLWDNVLIYLYGTLRKLILDTQLFLLLIPGSSEAPKFSVFLLLIKLAAAQSPKDYKCPLLCKSPGCLRHKSEPTNENAAWHPNRAVLDLLELLRSRMMRVPTICLTQLISFPR